MKVILVLLSVLLTAGQLISSEVPDPEEQILEMSDNQLFTNPVMLRDSAYLDTFIKSLMNLYNVPGLGASIIKDGEIIWEGYYGYENIQKNKYVSDSTIFLIGATAQTITSVVLMQLWENGLIELDTSISYYLPDSLFNPNFPDSSITLRQILTHTSSIEGNMALWDTMMVLGDSLITLQEYCDEYFFPGGGFYDSVANWFNYPPGTFYDRSYATAFALVGYIVQLISGHPFVDYTEDSLFQPLNIDNATWIMVDCDTNNLAMQYHWNGSNFEEVGHWSAVCYPSCFFRITVYEYSQFLNAFMQYGILNSTRILDSSTVDMMTSIQFPSVSPNFGLGWRMSDLSGRTIWDLNSGPFSGMYSRIGFCPNENSGIVIFTNGESWDCIDTIMITLFDYALQVGVQEEILSPVDNITFFADPRTGLVNIQYLNLIPEQIKIFDITGRNIDFYISKPDNGQIILDLSRQSNGIYYLVINQPSGSTHHKLYLMR